MANSDTEDGFEPFDDDADEFEVEVVDDTPEEDRGRDPLPQEIVQELEADELEDYSEKVKVRLKQMKKVWHDERRAKEQELREKNEAVAYAQRLMEENRRLKTSVSQNESILVGSFKQNAEFQLAQAEREYKEAYETGDTDKLLEAQKKLNRALSAAERISSYVPTLQEVDAPVQEQQQVQIPRTDPKTAAWQERNTWFGTDPEMTASALGLHQKLELERGPQFVGTDEYWKAIDNTMRRRFSDYFGEDTTTETTKAPRRAGSAPVVAPASRSTSPKKVVLNKSQIALAAKLGVPVEEYAKQVKALEKQGR
jgi:hypothetical protein